MSFAFERESRGDGWCAWIGWSWMELISFQHMGVACALALENPLEYCIDGV